MDSLRDILHTLLQRGGEVPYTPRRFMRPYRDWFIMLGAVSVLTLALVLFGTWQYLRVSGGEFLVAPSVPARGVPTISREQLDAVLERAATDSAQYESLRRSAPSVGRP